MIPNNDDDDDDNNDDNDDDDGAGRIILKLIRSMNIHEQSLGETKLRGKVTQEDNRRIPICRHKI